MLKMIEDSLCIGSYKFFEAKPNVQCTKAAWLETIIKRKMFYVNFLIVPNAMLRPRIVQSPSDINKHS